MQRDGNDESNDDGDDAEFFDVVVAGYATGEVVGDLSIKEGDASAKGDNDDANEEPAH